MRKAALTGLVFSLLLVCGQDLGAQERKGFIIGFGIGAGVTTHTSGFNEFTSDRETEVGFATDFKIGAQVSQSVQVYYLGRTNWFTPSGSDLVAAGISALGVTYVFPSAPEHLSGGIGFATWLEFNLSGGDFAGLGLTGGVGWEFADLWLLDFAVTYGMPGESSFDVNMFQARAGISILSH